MFTLVKDKCLFKRVVDCARSSCELGPGFDEDIIVRAILAIRLIMVIVNIRRIMKEDRKDRGMEGDVNARDDSEIGSRGSCCTVGYQIPSRMNEKGLSTTGLRRVFSHLRFRQAWASIPVVKRCFGPRPRRFLAK